MAVVVEATPNPRAMKFTVGSPVGGPATMTDPDEASAPFGDILRIDGVVSVFMTANFITVTRSEEASWDDLVEPISSLIAAAFE